MKRYLTAVGALALMNGGCHAVVLDPAQAAPPNPSALAFRLGDLPGGVVPGQPFEVPPVDPDTLVLFFSSQVETCEKPMVSLVCAETTNWQSIVVVPPELDRVGTFDLAAPGVKRSGITAISPMPSSRAESTGCASTMDVFPDETPQLPPDMGTLAIASTDATSLSVSLSGVGLRGALSSFDYSISIAGSYAAHRCSKQPALPAIAARASSLPPGSSYASLVPPIPPTSAPDPDGLVVFFGTAPESCSDPGSSIAGTAASRVVFPLPSAYQHVGDAFNALELGFVERGSPTARDVFGHDSPIDVGQVQILSIDTSTVTFSVGLIFVDDGTIDEFTGVYTASICP
jgi:hypothetical protein